MSEATLKAASASAIRPSSLSKQKKKATERKKLSKSEAKAYHEASESHANAADIEYQAFINKLLYKQLKEEEETRMKLEEEKMKKLSKPPSEKREKQWNKFRQRVKKAKGFYYGQGENGTKSWGECMRAAGISITDGNPDYSCNELTMDTDATPTSEITTEQAQSIVDAIVQNV